MARINPNEADKYQNNLNGEWLSLKNHGDVATVQFMFDVYDDIDSYVCHKIEVDGKERYVDCLRTYDEPLDNCPFCAAGIAAKPVNFILMFQHEDEKVKIWERGKQFLSKLQGLMNRYVPLSSYVFQIERNGKAGDQKTIYEIFPMDAIDPYDLNEIEKPELLGGLILDKTYEEMDIFLDTGSFPPTEEEQQQQAYQPAPRRGAAQTTQAPNRRAAAPARQQPAPQQPVRRVSTPAQQPAPQQPASRRGGSSTSTGRTPTNHPQQAARPQSTRRGAAPQPVADENEVF